MAGRSRVFPFAVNPLNRQVALKTDFRRPAVRIRCQNDAVSADAVEGKQVAYVFQIVFMLLGMTG